MATGGPTTEGGGTASINLMTRLQNKSDTAQRWDDSEALLLEGEIGYETDTNKFKIGDGNTTWSDLPYFYPDGIIYGGEKTFNELSGDETLRKENVIYKIHNTNSLISELTIYTYQSPAVTGTYKISGSSYTITLDKSNKDLDNFKKACEVGYYLIGRISVGSGFPDFDPVKIVSIVDNVFTIEDKFKMLQTEVSSGTNIKITKVYKSIFANNGDYVMWNGTDWNVFSQAIEPIDNLISTDTNKPLSANQGKILNDKITTIDNDVYNLTSSVNNNSMGFNKLSHTKLNISNYMNILSNADQGDIFEVETPLLYSKDVTLAEYTDEITGTGAKYTTDDTYVFRISDEESITGIKNYLTKNAILLIRSTSETASAKFVITDITVQSSYIDIVCTVSSTYSNTLTSKLPIALAGNYEVEIVSVEYNYQFTTGQKIIYNGTYPELYIDAFNNYIKKDGDKVLSTNDYTNDDKTIVNKFEETGMGVGLKSGSEFTAETINTNDIVIGGGTDTIGFHDSTGNYTLTDILNNKLYYYGNIDISSNIPVIYANENAITTWPTQVYGESDGKIYTITSKLVDKGLDRSDLGMDRLETTISGLVYIVFKYNSSNGDLSMINIINPDKCVPTLKKLTIKIPSISINSKNYKINTTYTPDFSDINYSIKLGSSDVSYSDGTGGDGTAYAELLNYMSDKVTEQITHIFSGTATDCMILNTNSVYVGESIYWNGLCWVKLSPDMSKYYTKNEITNLGHISYQGTKTVSELCSIDNSSVIKTKGYMYNVQFDGDSAEIENYTYRINGSVEPGTVTKSGNYYIIKYSVSSFVSTSSEYDELKRLINSIDIGCSLYAYINGQLCEFKVTDRSGPSITTLKESGPSVSDNSAVDIQAVLKNKTKIYNTNDYIVWNGSDWITFSSSLNLDIDAINALNYKSTSNPDGFYISDILSDTISSQNLAVRNETVGQKLSFINATDFSGIEYGEGSSAKNLQTVLDAKANKADVTNVFTYRGPVPIDKINQFVAASTTMNIGAVFNIVKGSSDIMSADLVSSTIQTSNISITNSLMFKDNSIVDYNESTVIGTYSLTLTNDSGEQNNFKLIFPDVKNGEMKITESNIASDSENNYSILVKTFGVMHPSGINTLVTASYTFKTTISVGDNIVWSGMNWDKLASTIDLSSYVTKSSLQENVNTNFLTSPEISTGKIKINSFDNIQDISQAPDKITSLKEVLDNKVDESDLLTSISTGTIDAASVNATNGNFTNIKVDYFSNVKNSKGEDLSTVITNSTKDLIPRSDCVNSLTSVSTTSPLAANQGKVLNNKFSTAKFKPSQITAQNDNTSGSVPLIYGAETHAVRNVSAFLPADAIYIEYTTDGGTTWTDYGSDFNKADTYNTIKLKQFAELTDVYIKVGGANMTNDNITDQCMTRITIDPTVDGRYSNAFMFYCWVNTAGASDVKCKIECSTMGNKDTFTTVRDDTPVSGWSGPNTITFSPKTFGGGASQSTNQCKFRFTFKSLSPNGKTPSVTDMRLYGYSVWTGTNNYMKTGTVYKTSYSQNVTFPNQVTAKTLEIESDGSIGTNLTTKIQNMMDVPISSTIPSTLVKNTIYDVGQQTSLQLNLPSSGKVEDYIQVDFLSLSTPTTLGINSSAGISDFSLVPSANTIYSLYFEWGALYYNSNTSKLVYGWRFKYDEYTHTA